MIPGDIIGHLGAYPIPRHCQNRLFAKVIAGTMFGQSLFTVSAAEMHIRGSKTHHPIG
jgi:hypothetical protein